MKIFLISVTSLVFVLLAFKQFITNRRIVQPDKQKLRYVFFLDLALIFALISSAVAYETDYTGIPFIIMLALSALYLLSISVGEFKYIKWPVLIMISLEIMIGILNFISISDKFSFSLNRIYLPVSAVLASALVFIFALGVFMRLRNIKNVMKAGSVWTSLEFAVDSIYLVLIVLFVMLSIILHLYLGMGSAVYSLVFTALYSSLYVALGIRMINSSIFVVMTEHERKIVESMKVVHVESRADNPGPAVLYKNIYDRIVDYFTDTKSYLNSNLTINDIVEVVFSNKLYISKAINQFTGRNFCQFVNYYRIIHAIELFRKNTNLKIHELASRSGFNSSVTFGTAFRLYMGEKPGDWCRREKYRLDKLKK